MPGAEWFPGTSLNYAEHIFRGKDPSALAIQHKAEGGELGRITWGELEARVGAFAAGLRSLGVERGDRVAAYFPNSPGALIGFLATASIGAIWSSCSPDFGARSVIDRFAQIEPKVLLAVDGYTYGGKDFDRMEIVAKPGGRDALPRDTQSWPATSTPMPTPRRSHTASPGRKWRTAAPARRSSSSASPSTTRSGSSTPPAPPGCRRPSSRATEASSWST